MSQKYLFYCVVLRRNFDIQNASGTRWETWTIILEGFILQVEVACLTTSFVKILTTVYCKNLYSVFYTVLGPLNQVFWKGLSELICFSLLIREILGRANWSGPLQCNILSPRTDISQLSEQLVQCFIMLIVNSFFPYQVSFPYSRLCPLSHIILQYVSGFCFLFVFRHVKALIYSLTLLFLRLDWTDLVVFWLYATGSAL